MSVFFLLDALWVWVYGYRWSWMLDATNADDTLPALHVVKVGGVI